MKTAEEWVIGEPIETSYWNSPANLISMTTTYESDHDATCLIEVVKQIQLDAFKAGERFAADFIINWCPSTHKLGGATCITCKELSKAILTDANNRTAMSDHNERAYKKCGSLLHHEDDCDKSMTPQTQAEQKAREFLEHAIPWDEVIDKYYERLTLLIQKAEEGDLFAERINNLNQRGSDMGLKGSVLEHKWDELIQQRDDYKQKADALDWLEKQKTIFGVQHNDNGWMIFGDSFQEEKQVHGETLLSAISQARKEQG